MTKKILLVNPPIYDFSAYDFWLKPFGLLRVGGFLRDKAELKLFDFLDRASGPSSDRWGRGKFTAAEVEKPRLFSSIPRLYRRYGVSEKEFRAFLHSEGPFDAILIQTNMTYWYQGIQEVLGVVKQVCPKARTVLGGNYATLCPDHAGTLGADLIIEGCSLQPLWDLLELSPSQSQPPLWESYRENNVGVLKLASGCPFRCSYCSVPQTAPQFEPYPVEESWRSFQLLNDLGAENFVFYDDALLFQPDRVLRPFLERVKENGFEGFFHTPNALNARFLDTGLAQIMVSTRFRLFYLGFESSAYLWQKSTGGKVSSGEFEQAVKNLENAGAPLEDLTAYLIVGHPETEAQEIEASMRMVHSLGVRIMLSEYSPIPGTPDGEKCREWIDLDEPLSHNKTAFSVSYLGSQRLQELKDLSTALNSDLPQTLGNRYKC